MALNPLYGYDTTLYGYGQANRPGGVPGRRMPAWMTDIQARGIGTAQTNNITAPGVIDIPRGNGLGGFNNAPQAPVTPPLVGDGIGDAWHVMHGGPAEGAGAETGIAGVGGDQSFSDFLAAIGIGGSSDPSNDLANDAKGLAGQSLYGGDGSIGSSVGDISNDGKSGDYGTGNNLSGFGSDAAGDVSAGDIAGASEQAAGMADAMGAMFNRGGVVTANRLRGPDPAGPDDGYAALNVGEGILTAAAMKHYGPGFLRRLNKLQVPKGR